MNTKGNAGCARRLALICGALAVLALGFFALSHREVPRDVSYGVSFSVYRAQELGLDWRETFDAILDDVGARKLRLAAYWPLTEPKRDQWDFSALDYQMERAERSGASVILGIGRRLPGWPECHVPDWAKAMPEDERARELLEYMRTVLERYKDSPALRFWQVENEPFLTSFATEGCGNSVNLALLQKEVALVHEIDPTHLALVTDSGEFGSWWRARRLGDVFGSSVYLYVWYKGYGPIRYPIVPAFFRIKQNVIDLVAAPDRAPSLLIELGLEPWLPRPIIETPLSEQLERMDLGKFREVLSFARKTGFAEQYLWGAEWWYYMTKQGHPEFWQAARELF